jgi:RNA polymerase sigma-70 factor (ECF subfamily)
MADAARDSDASRLAADTLIRLVDEHHRTLFAYAYRLTGSASDAEDLTQETYLDAYRSLHQLRERDKALPWLFQILRRRFWKSLRQERLRDLLEPNAEISELAAAAKVETPIDSEQLQHALGQLPEEYRVVLLLFYFEDLSYKEIAMQTNVPIGTVMSRLARAKAALRARLGAGSAGEWREAAGVRASVDRP